jgi:hypothetical protein
MADTRELDAGTAWEVGTHLVPHLAWQLQEVGFDGLYACALGHPTFCLLARTFHVKENVVVPIIRKCREVGMLFDSLSHNALA